MIWLTVKVSISLMMAVIAMTKGTMHFVSWPQVVMSLWAFLAFGLILCVDEIAEVFAQEGGSHE